MTGAPSPERWAIDISLLLNAVLGRDRFPVDVALVAREYSTQRYPDDPISLVVGKSLPGFDGALYRAPAGKRGWGIFITTPLHRKGESTSRWPTSSATIWPSIGVPERHPMR